MFASRLRTLTAFAAAAALIAAVMATAAAPAHAADPAPDRATSLSACVGDALEDAGFTDIDRLGAKHRDAVNCLAYYGITLGKSADPMLYAPGDSVLRSNMARFLYRTAEAAGIDIDADTEGRTAMFTDIDDLDEQHQDQVNALFAHGIMLGRNAGAAIAGVTSDTTFVPHEPITRAEMALYLRNLVRVARPDLYNTDGQLKGLNYRATAAEARDVDYFDDAVTDTPGPTSDAIAEVYELGITNGATMSPRAFNPEGPVTRGQMALFLTRTLAHTPARPVGLTVQADEDTAKLVVSYRGRDFQPTDDALRVDAFYTDADDAGGAFARGGGCDTSVVDDENLPGRYLCEIDRRDPELDNGDATIDFTQAVTSAGIAAWVWIGELGDEYADAEDDDVYEHVFDGSALPPPAASQLTVTYRGVDTDDNGNPLTARIDRAVTATVQMQGRYDGETELYDVPRSVSYTLTLRLDRDPVAPATIPTTLLLPATTTVTLDDNGRAEFTLLRPRSFDDQTSAYTSHFTLALKDPMVDAPTASGMVKFAAQAAAKVTTVEITDYDAWYPVATGDAEKRDVVVTVLDQFGQPMANQPVLFQARAGANTVPVDGAETAAPGDRKIQTDRNGKATFTYSRDNTAGIVTLHAGFDGDTNPDTEDAGDDGNGALCETPGTADAPGVDARDKCSTKVSVYYASAAVKDSSTHPVPDSDPEALVAGESYRIVHVDTDRRDRKIVVRLWTAADTVDDAGPWFVDYSEAEDGELFTDAFRRTSDTPSQQRRAWDAAMAEANKKAAAAAGKAAAMAADYCQLVWDTTGRAWEFEARNCQTMMS